MRLAQFKARYKFTKRSNGNSVAIKHGVHSS